MAAVTPAQLLLGELTCVVCLDFFKDPVSLPCGHHFCQACITQCWKRLRVKFSCPECKEIFSQRNFKPNRQLRNIVEASRKLTLEPAKEPEVGTMCEKHQRALDVFCQEDNTPICVVCHLSGDHKEHAAVVIEEAAEHYKVRNPRTVKLQCLVLDLCFSCVYLSFQKQLKTGRQKIVSEFQQLHQFLEEQERLLLAQLEELNQEIEKRRAEYVAKLSEEISSFSSLISEMEQKCQQPASEFLQLGKSWRREVAWFTPQLGQVLSLTRSDRPCPGAELCPSRSDSLSAANVTLDPDTAHPRLILSADRKGVRWGRHTRQNLPDNPERFDSLRCVLGSEGFTSGRHYWEVGTEMRGVWGMGVARESVSRKGRISFTPEQGIWAVWCWEDQYWAPTSPAQSIPFPPSQGPRRIRVYLDYEGERVAFFDAGTGDPMVTFPPASFDVLLAGIPGRPHESTATHTENRTT
uniref:Zinc finger protein RFP-like n=1 Tax=Chelonoidis abingdonii TaxID=106734 RepID=A0A8C0IS41_CHEAB